MCAPVQASFVPSSVVICRHRLQLVITCCQWDSYLALHPKDPSLRAWSTRTWVSQNGKLLTQYRTRGTTLMRMSSLLLLAVTALS